MSSVRVRSCFSPWPALHDVDVVVAVDVDVDVDVDVARGFQLRDEQ